MTAPARIFVVAVLALLVGACREAPPPPPASVPPATTPGELRPLTSRDGPAPPRPNSADLPADHPPLSTGPAVPAGEGLSGTVTVAPALAARVQPTDVLYLIARNAKTNTVVAVRRVDAARFPFAFRLTAEDVMVEGTAFVGPFDVTARLSKTGDAIAGKGDLEGAVKGVAAGAPGLSITLDSVRQ